MDTDTDNRGDYNTLLVLHTGELKSIDSVIYYNWHQISYLFMFTVQIFMLSIWSNFSLKLFKSVLRCRERTKCTSFPSFPFCIAFDKAADFFEDILESVSDAVPFVNGLALRLQCNTHKSLNTNGTTVERRIVYECHNFYSCSQDAFGNSMYLLGIRLHIFWKFVNWTFFSNLFKWKRLFIVITLRKSVSFC